MPMSAVGVSIEECHMMCFPFSITSFGYRNPLIVAECVWMKCVKRDIVAHWLCPVHGKSEQWTKLEMWIKLATAAYAHPSVLCAALFASVW